MRFASYLNNQTAGFGLIEGDSIVPLSGVLAPHVTTLRSLLAAAPDLATLSKYAAAMPDRLALTDVTLLPVIPDPSKIFCIGVNYETHREETGRAKLTYPIVFLRVSGSQVGHCGSMVKPAVSEQFDYEGEIAVVIGKAGRNIAVADAYDHVAGYSCYNDGSVRDWQVHTSQWTPGKNFESTGAFGPWLVTPDELGPIGDLRLKTRLNGQTVQDATVDQMIFSIPEQIAYLSTIVTLQAGDVIVTGTPGGVGAKRVPPLFMQPGDTVEVEVSGIGILSNPVVAQG